MFKLAFLAILAFCTKGTLGQQSQALTVVAADVCAQGTQTMPTGGSVTLTCTFTGFTAADVVPASTPNAASLEITVGSNLKYSIAADQTGTAPTVTTVEAGDTATAQVNTDNIVITVAAYPSANLDVAVACQAKQVMISGSLTDVTASAPVNLNTYCKDFTLAKATCDTNLPKLTCTTTGVALNAWEADATAVLNFRVGGTAKFSLSASNIAASTTSGNLDSSAGTWTATAADAVAVTAAPSTMATADQTAAWTCDITGASGAYNGDSATLTLTACPAYTLSATCSGTTVSALSLTTPGLTFTTFDGGAGYTITVYKGTEARYRLTSSTISSSALTGDLDAASTTIVAGTYSVASATATTWTFTPTVAITEADEGSDWRMVVSAATATNGGSGDVSITCGAEMNTVAGLLVALLVATKALFF